MAPRRVSIRDRNQASIAETDTQHVEPVQPAQDEPVQPAAAPLAPAQVTEPVTDTPSTNTSTKSNETMTLGIYFQPEQFTDAKAAYLADWARGGSIDLFRLWIAAAVDAHAGRTPQQRTTHAAPVERAKVATGSPRSFPVSADTVARMRAAITADQKAGRWLTTSLWCREAVERAVDIARREAGGTLPTPPARLPARLVR